MRTIARFLGSVCNVIGVIGLVLILVKAAALAPFKGSLSFLVAVVFAAAWLVGFRAVGSRLRAYGERS